MAESAIYRGGGNSRVTIRVSGEGGPVRTQFRASDGTPINVRDTVRVTNAQGNVSFGGQVITRPKRGGGVTYSIVEWDGTEHGDLEYWTNRGARIINLGDNGSGQRQSNYELIYDERGGYFRQRLKNNRR